MKKKNKVISIVLLLLVNRWILLTVSLIYYVRYLQCYSAKRNDDVVFFFIDQVWWMCVIFCIFVYAGVFWDESQGCCSEGFSCHVRQTYNSYEWLVRKGTVLSHWGKGRMWRRSRPGVKLEQTVHIITVYEDRGCTCGIFMKSFMCCVLLL